MAQSTLTVVSEGSTIADLHEELHSIKQHLMSMTASQPAPEAHSPASALGVAPDSECDILDLSLLTVPNSNHDASLHSDVLCTGMSDSSLPDHLSATRPARDTEQVRPLFH